MHILCSTGYMWHEDGDFLDKLHDKDPGLYLLRVSASYLVISILHVKNHFFKIMIC